MIEKLQRLGMTKSESQVYQLLVKYGSISGSQLAKKSGIDRSTTYNLLVSLNAKGFVSYIIKEGIKIYQISNPSNLRKFAEDSIQIAESVIEEINKTKQKILTESIAEVYEGPNAPKVMYNYYLESKDQEFYVYGGYGKMFQKLEPEMKGYIKKFISNKNFLYSFVSKDYPNLENLRKIPGKIKRTDFKSLPAGFTIGSDSVTFHVYEDESQVISIKHPQIAKVMRELFEIAWGKRTTKEVGA
ncbi:MAG: hypothetical protein IIA87_00755 [Nanoarchaeota archaeon]|nr:hypothetical protein [Nanoarchaeota archaeon]